MTGIPSFIFAAADFIVSRLHITRAIDQRRRPNGRRRPNERRPLNVRRRRIAIRRRLVSRPLPLPNIIHPPLPPLDSHWTEIIRPATNRKSMALFFFKAANHNLR